jgi:predicted RecB family nuclease
MQHKEFFDKCMESQRNSYRAKKYILADNRIIHYQSKLELAYIEYCEHNNIWIDNGDRIPYYDNNGKKHMYFVDFKIKEGDKYRLVEIKGTTKWYYKSIESGILLNKIEAAQKYSNSKEYLPFKMIIDEI